MDGGIRRNRRCQSNAVADFITTKMRRRHCEMNFKWIPNEFRNSLEMQFVRLKYDRETPFKVSGGISTMLFD